MIEHEFRYAATDELFQRVRGNTAFVKKQSKQLDIVFGWHSFDSLKKQGYICRIRRHTKGIHLQCKKAINEDTFDESQVQVYSMSDAISILNSMNMKPYLVIERLREVRSYKSITVHLDDIKLMGKYLEIEIPVDISEAHQKAQLSEFLKFNDITSSPLGLYGDLIKEKVKSDTHFSREYRDFVNASLEAAEQSK